MTTNARNKLIIAGVAVLVLFLGLLGTYLTNGNSWRAVIDLLTLPQCIIAYLAGLGLGVSWIIKKACGQDYDYTGE